MQIAVKLIIIIVSFILLALFITFFHKYVIGGIIGGAIEGLLLAGYFFGMRAVWKYKPIKNNSVNINDLIKLAGININKISPQKTELVSNNYSDSYDTKKRLLDKLKSDGVISEVVYREKLSELEGKRKVEQNDYLVKKRLAVERKALDQSLDMKLLTEEEHKVMVDALNNKIIKEVCEFFDDKTNDNKATLPDQGLDGALSIFIVALIGLSLIGVLFVTFQTKQTPEAPTEAAIEAYAAASPAPEAPAPEAPAPEAPAPEAPAPEAPEAPEAPATVESDDYGINIIKEFVKMEDARNYSEISKYFSDNMLRYWDIINPTLDEIYNKHLHQWDITTYSKNSIINIKKIDESTYILHTRFEYQVKKNNKIVIQDSRVKYVFDSNMKIIEVYGIN